MTLHNQYYTDVNIHPVTYNMQRYIPEELHHVMWVDIVDPTTLSVGDWVFDPRQGSYYAGQVTKICEWGDAVIVHWIKSKDTNEFDNIESHQQLMSMWWVDPTLE